MSKQDTAWLIVRTVGLLAAAGAIWHAVSFVYLIVLVVGVAPTALHSNPWSSLMPALYQLMICVFLAALAVYLLRGGARIHELLMRTETSANPRA